jgi:hypothetical protein
MKKYTLPLLSTCFLLICLGAGSTLFAQEKEGKKLQLGVNLSSSILKFPPSFVPAYRLQAYSPGLFVRHGNHMASVNWDFYTAFLFELPARSPQGFQFGYRYLLPELLPLVEVYGEFNYAYYSYVGFYQRIREIERRNLTNGTANYIYMGNLAAGMYVPFLDRFSAGGSVGYGVSFFDKYFLDLNRSVTEWRKHAYFRMEVNVRVF